MITQERLRTQQVDTILDANWRTFNSWVAETGAHQTLQIPADAAAVLIPRRILEVAQDPQNVRLDLRENYPGNIRLIVVESFRDPISDPEAFEQWRTSYPERLGKVAVLDELMKALPKGLDYKHVEYHSDIESGKLSLSDKILIEYSANVFGHFPHLVETRSYKDRIELQRMGIGTSYYQRFETALKKLGFRYLSGVIISSHPGFFAKTRARYEELPDDVKVELPDHYSHPHSGWMIRVL